MINKFHCIHFAIQSKMCIFVSVDINMQRLGGLESCSFQQPASMATESIRTNLVTTTLGPNNFTEKIKRYVATLSCSIFYIK